MSVLPVALYQLCGWHWLAIPWPVVAMLGTAAAFIVGFKNAQTYNRTMEAQQIWGAIASSSRYWGLISRDFPSNVETSHTLIYRHLAWLTAVRYQLRGRRIWEAAAHEYNFEYRRQFFDVPEHEVTLESELQKYLPPHVLAQIGQSKHLASNLMALQSLSIKELFASQDIPVLHHTEMQKTLKDLIDQHARAERVKNFPYPRQYAIVDSIFVWVFAVLLPFGIVKEFDKLNGAVTEGLAGHMGWLAVPFSVLVSWMYVSLDQVGESTENPFEGGANDVPITQICRQIEIEMRELLGERDLPSLPEAQNNIVL